ncbi:CHRD domain-containing protein [Deinococcus navajonensis]|uniref:CHRD domain-containing protein n=1 Tax=Deinococcus navajonensis TaxID=309884 RepID=A0ABV8XMI1_9DEIO
MMGKTLVLVTGMVTLLSACTMMDQPKSLAFRHNAVTADPQAAGTAQVTTRPDGMVTTTLVLTGLTPGKTYAAHYHAFGPDSSTDPCASNGPVSVGFPSFTADASGRATTSVSSEMARIAGDLGAYINVHYADDLKVVPVCAPIKMTKG